MPSSESTLQLCTLQNLIIDTISIIIMRKVGKQSALLSKDIIYCCLYGVSVYRAECQLPSSGSNQSVQTCRRGRVTCSLWGLPQSVPTHEMPFVVCQCVIFPNKLLASTSFVIDELTTKIGPSTLTNTINTINSSLV